MVEHEASRPDEIRDTERDRLRALVAGDVEKAMRMHADDFQLINPAGESISKAAYLGMIASGELQYLVWDPEDIAVHRYGEDAAVIRYRSVIDARRGGRSSRGRYWHTDTYERRAGRWQVVWSHATQTADR
jgi:ketosteroid isomerase-like protein